MAGGKAESCTPQAQASRAGEPTSGTIHFNEPGKGYLYLIFLVIFHFSFFISFTLSLSSFPCFKI
jgi:hypothetical protein